MRKFSILKRGRLSQYTSLLRLFSGLLILSMLISPIGALAAPSGSESNALQQNKAIFFVSDGMRQDLVEDYAAQGLLPTMNGLLRNGAKAADNGLLTQVLDRVAPRNAGFQHVRVDESAPDFGLRQRDELLARHVHVHCSLVAPPILAAKASLRTARPTLRGVRRRRAPKARGLVRQGW